MTQSAGLYDATTTRTSAELHSATSVSSPTSLIVNWREKNASLMLVSLQTPGPMSSFSSASARATMLLREMASVDWAMNRRRLLTTWSRCGSGTAQFVVAARPLLVVDGAIETARSGRARRGDFSTSSGVGAGAGVGASTSILPSSTARTLSSFSARVFSHLSTSSMTSSVRIRASLPVPTPGALSLVSEPTMCGTYSSRNG